MSKVCGNCRYFLTTGCSSVCTLYCSETSYGEWCRNHEGRCMFDSIITSPEVLAEAMVYEECEHSILDANGCGATFPGGYTSAILECSYKTKTEAIAATLERLKEVEVRSE